MREPEVHGLRWVYDWLGENIEPGRMVRDDKNIRGGGEVRRAPVNLNCIVLRDELDTAITNWITLACETLNRVGPKKPASLSEQLRWLNAQLAIIEDSDIAAPMWAGFSDLMSRSHAAAPWRANPRPLVGVPCPGCHRRTLVIYGGEVDAQCRLCRTVIPQQHYGLWVKIVAGDASEVQRQKLSELRGMVAA
jgi:hypothetical protein